METPSLPGKKRKRYTSRRERRAQIIGRRSIAQRPTSVETRHQVGHWEGDILIGVSHKQAMLTTVEIKIIQDLINHRPRKRLVFKTPHEVFHQSLKRDALRT